VATNGFDGNRDDSAERMLTFARNRAASPLLPVPTTQRKSRRLRLECVPRRVTIKRRNVDPSSSSNHNASDSTEFLATHADKRVRFSSETKQMPASIGVYDSDTVKRFAARHPEV
jgi:hypothetical protein